MKKYISRVLSLFLVLTMVLGIIPTTLADDCFVTITGALTSEVGETVSLAAEVVGVPEGGHIAYDWKAPVLGCRKTHEFKATEAGSIPISVTATIFDDCFNLVGEVSDTKVIVVTEPENENFIELSESSLDMVPGQSVTLKATTYPIDTVVTWESSNTAVATVTSAGKVTAKALSTGTATAVITATTAEGEKAYCTVTVTSKVVKLNVSQTSQTLTMEVGDSTYWDLGFLPSSAPAYITFSSSNSNVVAIDKYGQVTVKKAGTATVTARLSLDALATTEGWVLGTPSVVTCDITVGGSTYISCDNETSDGSYIMLEPVLYHNGYVVSNAEFYYTHTSGIEVYTSNNETFSVEPGNKESGTVTFTLKSASYNGVAIDPADVPSKTVSVSFCETADLQVEVDAGISDFRFDDEGIAASATYGMYGNDVVNSSRLYTYSLWDLINLAMSDTTVGTNIDYYEFSVNSSSGGELTAPTGGNSNWTTGNKRVSAAYADTVGFRQKSTTNQTTTFTVSAMDGNVAVAAVNVTLTMIEVPTGTCGENLTWRYAGGVLTISGSGKMYDYNDKYATKRTPWYAYKSNIKEVILPGAIKNIGNYAFYNCQKLEIINLPDGLTTIGEWAFEECNKLAGIILPDSMISIGYHALSGCDSLKEIIIPDGVTTIEDYAFYYSSGLAKITLPKSVTTIGFCAFSGCSNLWDVYFSGSEADWSKIEIGEYNEELLYANLHTICEGAEVSAVYTDNQDGTHTVVKTCSACGGDLGSITEVCKDGNTDGLCDGCKAVLATQESQGYELCALTLRDSSGNAVTSIPAGNFYAEAKVKKLQDGAPVLVVLETYTKDGNLLNTAYLQAAVPTGSTYTQGCHIVNDGHVGEVKAFLLSSLGNPAPLGEAISVK